MTIKNYFKNLGFSSCIHASAENLENPSHVQIKGPMGKGLGIPTTGRNIAFTAGTGVLVFIDLVAHLLLQVIMENDGQKLSEGKSENAIDLSKFRFELYTAFPNENEAFALDLIQCLQNLCFKHGLVDLFEHHNAIGGYYYECFPKDGIISEPLFFHDKFKEFH